MRSASRLSCAVPAFAAANPGSSTITHEPLSISLTLMFTGAHANAGSPGVLAHNFAFDSFSVNGKALNEVGINALIAGELGVSVSLVSGDDVLIEETRRMLPNDFVAIVTKRMRPLRIGDGVVY